MIVSPLYSALDVILLILSSGLAGVGLLMHETTTVMVAPGAGMAALIYSFVEVVGNAGQAVLAGMAAAFVRISAYTALDSSAARVVWVPLRNT